jgi:predicted amidohydrolase
MVQNDDNPQPLVAACVQFDVRRGDVDANVRSVRDGLELAIAASARLCVLPELWSTSFMPGYAPDVLAAAAAAEHELRELSARHELVVVGSAVESTPAGAFNCARVYDRGDLLGSYRKIHLFSPIAEHKHHLAGDRPLLVDTSVGRLGVLICYDLRFPDLARYYFHMGAEVLVVPAQWPEARSQHWRTLLRARAIENEMFVIGCNRTGHETSLKNDEAQVFTGDGRIVDPTGEILAAGNGESAVFTADLELRKVRTVRRVLPVERDQRPSVYRQLWDEAWPSMQKASRESGERDGT